MNLPIPYDIHQEGSYDDLHKVDCDAFKRRLDRMMIHLVDMPTGKSALRDDPTLRQSVLDDSCAYLHDHLPQGTIPVIFSYKDLKDALILKYAGVFGEGFNEHRFSWFGVIRGTNDYREERYIAQIGINRYRREDYFLYELEKNTDLLKTLKRSPYSEHQQIIMARLRDPYGITKEAEQREILAELEQNIFRGTIRNANEVGEYHFWLFTSFRHRDLTAGIKGRFEPLLATVEEIPQDEHSKIVSLMRRSNSTHAQAIVRCHDEDIGPGELYTYQVIAEKTLLSKQQIKTARNNNPILQELFDSERTDSRNRRFRKERNWYFGLYESESEETEEEDETEEE